MFQSGLVQGSSPALHQTPVRLVKNYHHFIGEHNWGAGQVCCFSLLFVGFCFVLLFKVSKETRAIQSWGYSDPEGKIKNPAYLCSEITNLCSVWPNRTHKYTLSWYFIFKNLDFWISSKSHHPGPPILQRSHWAELTAMPLSIKHLLNSLPPPAPRISFNSHWFYTQ